MRFHLFSLSVILIVLCLIGNPSLQNAQAKTPVLPGLGPVTHYTLPNGLQVIVAPSDNADLVTVDAWVGAGTRRETARNNGAAHFMEHLIFKGTPTRKPGEIDAAIEDLGGTLNASTSYDWAHFYVTVGSSDTEAALGIVSDALINADLRQEDMDAERPVILSEMAREDASPQRQINKAFDALEFPSHPYGRPLLGSALNISTISRQTVQDFYHNYYVPGNVTLILSGSLTPETGLAMAKKTFGTWAARPVASDQVLPEPEQTEIRTDNLTGAVTQGYLTLGFRAPSVHDQPDAYVMDILLTILGQGGNDRLEEQLQRKQKIVTAASANYLTKKDPGVITLSASFEPINLQKVIEGMLEQVKKLRDYPVSDTEIAAAKHSLLASYLFDVQTTSGRANALGFYNMIDSYEYDTEYIKHFESVTPAQVQSVARKYLNPKAYTLVTLLPRTSPFTASNL